MRPDPLHPDHERKRCPNENDRRHQRVCEPVGASAVRRSAETVRLTTLQQLRAVQSGHLERFAVQFEMRVDG